MQNALLDQGLSLMIYGMGTVFVFLALLVLVTTLMSSIVTRFFKEAEPAQSQPNMNIQQASSLDDPKLVAIISAAIAQHRKAQS